MSNDFGLCPLGTESFGDVWPLKYTKRINIIKCGTAIMRKMNILALSEERRKEKKSHGEDSGTTDGRREAGTGLKHPSETIEGYNGARRKHAPPGEETTDRLNQTLEVAEKEELKSSDDDIHLNTTIDEFERHREELDRISIIRT